MNLDHAVVAITGGASGIGFGMAQAFGARGARLVLLDVEAPALADARERLLAQGCTVETLQIDVSDRDAVARCAQDAVAVFGHVNVLCNNAGVNAAGPVDTLSHADWDWVLGVNLHGVINCTLAFLAELKRHGRQAHIINTASTGGLIGMRNLAPYNTSKFAVVGFSEALRADLEESGVGVSVLCPGVVRTNLPDSARNRPDATPAANESDATSESATGAAESPLVVMEAGEVGEVVVESVLRGDFYICTHPEFVEAVRNRHSALERSFGPAPDTAAAHAVFSLVRPFSNTEH